MTSVPFEVNEVPRAEQMAVLVQHGLAAIKLVCIFLPLHVVVTTVVYHEHCNSWYHMAILAAYTAST
jgi:hypothetical protein